MTPESYLSCLIESRENALAKSGCPFSLRRASIEWVRALIPEYEAELSMFRTLRLKLAQGQPMDALQAAWWVWITELAAIQRQDVGAHRLRMTALDRRDSAIMAAKGRAA